MNSKQALKVFVFAGLMIMINPVAGGILLAAVTLYLIFEK